MYLNILYSFKLLNLKAAMYTVFANCHDTLSETS